MVYKFLNIQSGELKANGHMHNKKSLYRIYRLVVLATYADTGDINESLPGAPSGVYDVTVAGVSDTVQVFCDTTTSGGGWTVCTQHACLRLLVFTTLHNVMYTHMLVICK